ncbi:hypothetical protein BST81_16190 [Leptolyngbya sp. 'hensonii']|uniref:phage holin family protein n=1 Tax=Leptolyngbya sp. 'hensonii' TaxID=1922337 RepID=UPI00094FA682|nr:phage holin family protein [Leptolyngbya sp. 'hensonii']OLP17342.1 hypothetical protein BST81_16190 [Leptolyngbya sp. 'hensonii']
MTAFLIAALITAVSLLIISKLPLGIQVDSFWKALVAAIVFGILNGIAQSVPGWITFLPKLLTLGLFSLIANAIIFGLAAWLVRGFDLRWGFWSALLGSIALSFVNSILSWVLDTIFPNLIR